MSTSEQLPKVSIKTLAFNHEKFIAQAIESVLMQKVNFSYELVIGEDCSTDDTRRIVRDYQKKYPGKIRPLLYERNMGRRYNMLNTIKESRGQYIALLDGDDYWTSDNKLQKQVDFLDRHPECSICFHNVKLVYEDGNSSQLFHSQPLRPVLKLQDLIDTNFIPTCSAVFRNHLFDEFPELFDSIPFGDWPLHILNAQKGDIGYIDEVMAVYRIHPGGLWSVGGVRSREQKEERHRWTIKFYQAINEHLEFKYDKPIKRKISELQFARFLLNSRLITIYELLLRKYKRWHHSRLT